MKIAGQENISAVLSASQTEAASSRRAGESGGFQIATADSDPAGSSLTLSSRSEEASLIVEIARAAPDYRADKVEQARADLAAGRLMADPMAIAEKMAEEIF